MTRNQSFWAFWATGFGFGFWPWGPGTVGSAVAVALWALCGLYVTTTALSCITFAAIVLFTIIGTIAANKLEPIWGEDSNKVVIDEMVGVWIPLLVCKWLSWHMLLAFVLFRFFDILKPLGIRLLDRRHGGFWVMADDILAGIYSLVLILIFRCLGI
jgi:phosphatidylglycerophosphatase A